MPAPAGAVRETRGPFRPAMLTWITAGVLLVALLAVGAWWLMNRDGGNAALERGIAHLNGGRREAARGEFSKAARDEPEQAEPHIFLGRMAREEGDAMTARRELETAIRLEPTNATAQREMGALLFSLGNYELARRFYVRAVQLNPEDRGAMGALGCSLVRLGQFDAGMRFIQRAGQGPWTACAAAPPAPPPS
jgi:Flp pilus assembly protein TadD